MVASLDLTPWPLAFVGTHSVHAWHRGALALARRRRDGLVCVNRPSIFYSNSTPTAYPEKRVFVCMRSIQLRPSTENRGNRGIVFDMEMAPQHDAFGNVYVCARRILILTKA